MFKQMEVKVSSDDASSWASLELIAELQALRRF